MFVTLFFRTFDKKKTRVIIDRFLNFGFFFDKVSGDSKKKTNKEKEITSALAKSSTPYYR